MSKNFVHNKYRKLYMQIITRAIERDPPEGYTEKHHILPRSIGGDNSPENLVVLTAREHFICHYLLPKFCIGGAYYKMTNASMFFNGKANSGKGYINSRLYAVMMGRAAQARSLTTEQFITKAKKIHGDRYDYSKTEYITLVDKVTFICREHGEFEQTPNSHTQGKGCPDCGSEDRAKTKTLTVEQFITKAKKIHGDRYDYSKTEYIYSKEKVTFICREHGEFEQTPNSHLLGRGCPDCGKKAN